MATKKIIYFTAGASVTPEEKADIDALNALTVPVYSLKVANSAVLPNLGMMPNPDPEPDPEDPANVPALMDCDFVAGTIPDDYSEKDEIDPDAPPAPDVGEERAVVADGQIVTIGAETFTFTVVDGELTAIAVGEA